MYIIVESINLDDELYKNETFAIQIFTSKKTWVSVVIKDDYSYKTNILLEDKDAVAVRISIDKITANKKRFFVEYMLADTAALDFSYLTLQACFEKMLRLASRGFINLPPYKPTEFF